MQQIKRPVRQRHAVKQDMNHRFNALRGYLGRLLRDHGWTVTAVADAESALRHSEVPDLILTDENDVLESGIDIVARPPGKQLQSITLLSGGEQTMTAVALLFSIYQVKPSPFCVLDELDAPLDESNINRFIRVLQRFIEHSQFIIITHNKRTIGMADVLYGVTMQEHGISKIVSVKFHKMEETSAATTTTTGHERELVPPPPGPTVEEMEDAPHTRAETLEVAPK